MRLLHGVMRFLIQTKWRLTAIAISLGIMATLASNVFVLSWSSCCMRCGLISHSWQFWNFAPMKSFHQTFLSNSSPVRELIPAHAHDWKCIHGSGQGIYCLIGEGRFIARAAKDAKFVATLETIHRVMGPGESKRIIDLVLNPNISHRVTNLYSIEPSDLPLNEESFRSWYEEQWRTVEDIKTTAN